MFTCDYIDYAWERWILTIFIEATLGSQHWAGKGDFPVLLYGLHSKIID
jgi:hypothetical protein